jgi:DNA repair exonuclease SbcCD ATPase subunit
MHTIELYVTECPVCGITHGIPNSKIERMQDRGGSVYCPNGHGWHFIDSAAERLQKQLAAERAAHDQTKAAQQEVAKKLERAMTRVKNGVCPHCNRLFTNLRRHMASKHSCGKEAKPNG